MPTIMITGGAGFIGSNFVKYLLEHHPYYQIINFDALTYAGNMENLVPVTSYPNYTFVRGDITDERHVDVFVSEGVDVIVNFAAESHVDRSLTDAAVFVRTNVLGTQVLLAAAKRHEVSRFIQISTDEVYGSLGSDGLFSEISPLAPNSPYAASKASADMLVRAYHHTHGLNTCITRCSNNYGPNQFPEKLIPLTITNALENKKLPVYGDGCQIRDWLHVWDHCRAIDLVLHQGTSGEVYNIGGSNERTNLQIIKAVLTELGKPESLIEHVSDRPGHDRRYAIDAAKIRAELGWMPSYTFKTGLRQTIQWYVDNQAWWKKLKDGAFTDYHEKMYGARPFSP